MAEMHELYHAAAVRDFRDARRRAAVQDVIARLTGKPGDLLAYDEIKSLVKHGGSASQGLEEIPLDAIVGSVGRYADFTRRFLPRRDSDESRWTQVKLKAVYAGGLPPIDVYRLGEVYFVLDGNHRVSVARQLGAKTIQARVTEIPIKVPLTADMQPDDLIISVRLANFLERTELDRTRPETDFTVTAPGSYRELQDQIEGLRRRLGETTAKPVTLPAAAMAWHDELYLPVVEMIRERHLLRDFPNRTQADLFVWIARHRDALEAELGWPVDPVLAAADLSAQKGGQLGRSLARLGDRLRQALSPAALRAGPAAGHWRQEHGEHGRDRRLFGDILLPVNGDERDWNALEQGLHVARREQGRVRGLFTVASAAEAQGEATQRFQEQFLQRCQEAQIEATLAVEVGPERESICRHARWTDLVVVSLSQLPEARPASRLGSDLRVVIQRCSRPVLALPGAPSPTNSALLAYDGSPKANEALFVAAYLAGRWQIPLTVLTVPDDRLDAAAIRARAFHYLQARGVLAEAAVGSGEVGQAILRARHSHGCDLIIMGGYGYHPVLELVLGSAVDAVLAGSPVPVLICR